MNPAEARSSRGERVIGSDPLAPLAADLAVGLVIAARLEGRSVPARVERIIRRPNGSVFAAVRTVLTGVFGYVRFDGHRRVHVLPKHYGICVECQSLSPCPHQQIEEQAARLHAESDPINELELTYYAADAGCAE